MASLNGKWKLVSTENFMDYVKAIGTPEAQQAQAKALEDTSDTGLFEEFVFDGSSIKRTLTAAGGKLTREATIKVGEQTKGESIDGRPIDVKITVAGDTFTRVEKGPGYESTWIRQIIGDDMTVTMTSGSVKCVRKYKRV